MQPLDEKACKKLLVNEVSIRLGTPQTVACDIVRKMAEKFVGLLRDDFDKYIPTLDFSDSCVTLHDHEIGAEILRLTDIKQRFFEFAGKDKIRELFSGTYAEFSGPLLEDHVNNVIVEINTELHHGETWRKILVNAVAAFFKRTRWWEQNRAGLAKILEKNRYKMRQIKFVHEG